MSLHQQLLDATAPDGFIHGCGECGQDQRAEAALHAVIELHAPAAFWRPWANEPQTCKPCGVLHGDTVPWPCPTIQAIARELGIETGEGRD